MLLPVGAGGALQDVGEPLFRAPRADRSDDDDDDDGGEGDGYRCEHLRDCVSAAFCHKPATVWFLLQVLIYYCK